MNMPYAFLVSTAFVGSLGLLAAGESVEPTSILSPASNLTALAILGTLAMWIVAKIIPSMQTSRDMSESENRKILIETIAAFVTSQKALIDAQGILIEKLTSRQREDREATISAMASQNQTISAMQQHCTEVMCHLRGKDSIADA